MQCIETMGDKLDVVLQAIQFYRKHARVELMKIRSVASHVLLPYHHFPLLLVLHQIVHHQSGLLH